METVKESKQPIKWIVEGDQNYKLLKKKIIEKPILALPDLIFFSKFR